MGPEGFFFKIFVIKNFVFKNFHWISVFFVILFLIYVTHFLFNFILFLLHLRPFLLNFLFTRNSAFLISHHRSLQDLGCLTNRRHFPDSFSEVSECLGCLGCFVGLGFIIRASPTFLSKQSNSPFLQFLPQ